jgi:hypothetical protein
MLRVAGKDSLEEVDVQESELEELEDKYKAALEYLKANLEVGIILCIIECPG